MKLSQFFGVTLILVGIGSIGHWGDHDIWHVTAEDRQNLARQADNVGIPELTPHPKGIFLYLGIAALGWGGRLLK